MLFAYSIVFQNFICEVIPATHAGLCLDNFLAPFSWHSYNVQSANIATAHGKTKKHLQNDSHSQDVGALFTILERLYGGITTVVKDFPME